MSPAQLTLTVMPLPGPCPWRPPLSQAPLQPVLAQLMSPAVSLLPIPTDGLVKRLEELERTAELYKGEGRGETLNPEVQGGLALGTQPRKLRTSEPHCPLGDLCPYHRVPASQLMGSLVDMG